MATAGPSRAGRGASLAPEIAIACAFDDGWVPHFAACATSIAASRGAESIHFILFEGTLSAPRKAATGDFLRDLGFSHEFLSPSADVLSSLPPAQLTSSIVWYRLLLPGLLPDRDRVLSLDADTLVLHSLAPLFATDLEGNLLAAVAAPAAAYGPGHDIGLGPAHQYFNAGVMVMDLGAMREQEIAARCMALGHERSAAFTYAEQDALNLVAHDSWLMLPPRWNALSYLWVEPKLAPRAYSALELATARHSPAVVHFEGGQIIKPWYFRCSHPLRGLYSQFRAETPWPLERLEEPSASGLALRRLPISWQYAISRLKNSVAGRIRRR